MAFIDNFSFAFQEITLESYTKNLNKYWEKVKDSSSQILFKWIILERWRSINDDSLDRGWQLGFTSKEYELYSKVDILPNKWDKIILDNNIFEVIFVEKVYMNKKHDHNKSILIFVN